MSKRVLILFLALALLAGGVGAAAAAGSAEDPLVSLSYAKSWAQALFDDAAPQIEAQLERFYARASASVEGDASASSARVALGEGGALRLSQGAAVTLLSGAATVRIDAGALVNATVGAAAVNGKLNPGQLYIACEGADVTVTAGAASALLVDGSYTATPGRLVFTDVPETAWYYADVYSAVALGLIDGVTETTYKPDGEFTVAQALKVAACMHQLWHEGEVTLQNGKPWYASYVAYAVENGVAEARYAELDAAAYNAPISRREYVHLFYNALPDTEYAAVNSIADDAIPDVKLGDDYAAEIYAFYRAGILDGTLADGSFLPDTNIKRSAVAAIIARMFDETARKTLTLPLPTAG